VENRWSKPQIAFTLLVALLMIGLPVMFGVWMMWPVSLPSGLVSPDQVSIVPTPRPGTPAAQTNVANRPPGPMAIGNFQPAGAWKAQGANGAVSPLISSFLVTAL
jgi:hypothetical protein